MSLTEFFLGAIALATLTMATLQVAAIVLLLRVARSGGQLVQRLEQDVTPIVDNLRLVSADAAKTSALAAAQVQRLDQALHNLSSRAESLFDLLQAIVRPAGKLSLLLAAARLLRGLRPPRRRRPRRPTDAEPTP